jgi:membrane protein involved in colicin uptake
LLPTKLPPIKLLLTIAADNAAIVAQAAKLAADAAAAKSAADTTNAALKAASDKAAADAATAKANADAAAATGKSFTDAAAKVVADRTAAEKAAAAKVVADKIAADKAAADAAAATTGKAAADKAAADKVLADRIAAERLAATTGTRSIGLAWALNNGMTQDQYYKNIFEFYKKNSGKSDSILRSEMDRLQISPQDVAAATGVTLESVLTRYNAAKATTQEELDVQAKAQADLAAREAQWAAQKKANEDAWKIQEAKNAADWAAQQKLTQDAQSAFGKAPMTLGQKFGSYESIPIGAQYNPAVTPGGKSPYSLVMGQMTPFQNPYANFVPGTALGGYNPNLYSDIAVNNANAAAAKEAADTKAANDALLLTGSTGGSDSGGDGGGTSGGDGGGTGAGAGTGNAMAKGGYVHGGLMFGPDPKGPDDGAVNLDIGEYVIKKSSVDKYGRGLLEMINEGKISAKKIRSLLD